MLKQLYIINYALIEESIIDFSKGFTVITGETGAGKSIMLDALSLLMGARADSKIMGDKNKKTIVEAIFSNPDPEIKNIFDENEIEWDQNELILRREISISGKSRGFINDTPVNLGIMNKVSERLIDIHSQHSNTLLNQSSQQLNIIDSFAGNDALIKDYRKKFKEYVALRNKIKNIKEAIIKGKENKEYITFRLEQLEKVKPKRGELAQLEREFEILGDSDKIKTQLSEAQLLIGESSGSALKQIQTAAAIIANINTSLFEPENENNLFSRLESIKIELRDISDTLENFSEKINSDPERFEKIQRRINTLYESFKRFKVKDENELVTLHENLKEELKKISGNNEDVSLMETELKELAKSLKEKAEKLTESRINSAKKFSSIIEEIIKPLGLSNLKFNVEIQKGKMTSEGQDIIAFYCSFNKNHSLQPVAEIASGGEISRVMLGIKSIMAGKMNLPTIIFDEIDTGVSGEIAHKMGEMMKKMSENIQVISVTHLPQVASHGDSQLKVYKADDTDKTVSHIKLLTPSERITEIAGMLSGTSINEVALENARILLNYK